MADALASLRVCRPAQAPGGGGQSRGCAGAGHGGQGICCEPPLSTGRGGPDGGPRGGGVTRARLRARMKPSPVHAFHSSLVGRAEHVLPSRTSLASPRGHPRAAGRLSIDEHSVLALPRLLYLARQAGAMQTGQLICPAPLLPTASETCRREAPAPSPPRGAAPPPGRGRGSAFSGDGAASTASTTIFSIALRRQAPRACSELAGTLSAGAEEKRA